MIHMGPRKDVEGYVQETGYGGRDGLICCTEKEAGNWLEHEKIQH